MFWYNCPESDDKTDSITRIDELMNSAFSADDAMLTFAPPVP